MEECGGLESCKEKFDELELLDVEEDAVQAEVENLEACTQYVALGRTIGGLLSELRNLIPLFPESRA